MNETAAGRPKQLLADLAKAMQSAAETARQAAIDGCRSSAKAHTDYLTAQPNAGVAKLRSAAAEDLNTIRDQSRAQIEKVRTEADERTTRRQEQLERELDECRSAVDVEVERVRMNVDAFQAELARFFEQLVAETDPTSFARLAAQIPDPPTLGEPDPATSVRELRGGEAPAEPQAELAQTAVGELPDHWWLDSPAQVAARAHGRQDSRQTA